MTTHPSVEELLERSVDSITVETDPDAVLQAIETRRARRRSDATRRHRTRRTAMALGAAAATVAVVGLLTLAARDDLSSIDAAAPSTSVTTRPTAPPTPAPEVIRTVQPPGDGQVVTALGGDATGFWVTRGTPATVTRIETDGTVGASTRLQGAALLAAADPTHLWLLVEEPDAGDQPYRLKQIDRSDGTLLASHVVTLGGPPIGLEVEGDSIVASWGGGAVELDRSGNRRSSDPLWAVDVRQQATAGDLRWSLAAPVDGAALLRSTDPSGATASTTLAGARRIMAVPALGPGTVAIERALGGGLEVEARRTADDPAPERLATLEPGESLAWATRDAIWVTTGPTLERRSR